MPAKTKNPKRNRSAEALAQGQRLVAFTITTEDDRTIDAAAAFLAGSLGRCTRVQALSWLIREGGKKIQKKRA